jgi:L-aminopeptidase/D-esterase-like protein
MNRTGPQNLITDVAGLRVGNADDAKIRSGVTVIVPDAPAIAAVDVRGGGPGTRETDALRPEGAVAHVHGIVLAGGSAFGLDAAAGLMAWLAAADRGFAIAGQVVPIVPAAILFDLANGGDKSWTRDTKAPTPYRNLAVDAAASAGQTFALGNAGAGFGAAAGPLKGGLGSASVSLGNGITVGAIAAVNSLGSAVMPGGTAFWAWPFERDGEFGSVAPRTGEPVDLEYSFDATQGANTTIAVVATDARLTRVEALRVATMAQDGIARAIRPVHTPLDGDTVFVLSTGAASDELNSNDIAKIGAAGADALARAIARGVYEARTLGDMPGYDTL